MKKLSVLVVCSFILIFTSAPAIAQGTCLISISPPEPIVAPLGTVQFTADVDGTCGSPCYNWSITEQESIGSTISNTGLYTAGTSEGTDEVTVTDECNDNYISASTPVVVSNAECTTAEQCNDEVNCTIDLCIEGTCSNIPDDDFCDDGLYCTGVEFCDEIDGCSSSGNPCEGGTECIEETTSCDPIVTCNCGNGIKECEEECDGDDLGSWTCWDLGYVEGVLACLEDCTFDTSKCTTACTTHGDCDDGLYCNGVETCEEGTCQPGIDVDCSEKTDQCNVGVCYDDTDACEPYPVDDGIICNDGLYCTELDACSNGVCKGLARDCDDGLYCTGEESCDEDSGLCVSSGNPCTPPEACNEESNTCADCSKDADCDDGIYCNGGEICGDNGRCQDGIPPCEEGGTCDEENDICEVATIEASIRPGWAFPNRMQPSIVTIQGTGTNFTWNSMVDYDFPYSYPVLIARGLPKVIVNTQTIRQIILVSPPPPLGVDYPVTVTVTVDGLSGQFEIDEFKFPFLPF